MSTFVFCAIAIYSTVEDRKSIPMHDPLRDRKIDIVDWCRSRHYFSMAISLILVIVSVNAMFNPQAIDWSPPILALTSVPLLLNLKLINDLIRKSQLLRKGL